MHAETVKLELRAGVKTDSWTLRFILVLTVSFMEGKSVMGSGSQVVDAVGMWMVELSELLDEYICWQVVPLKRDGYNLIESTVPRCKGEYV